MCYEIYFETCKTNKIPVDFTQMRFSCVNIKYRQYSKEYDNYIIYNTFGRKIKALPMAIWSGICKTIYHIALLIIFAKSASNDQRKAFVFCAVRDLQESFGYLLSLLRDRWGYYHIEASLFHKDCYDEILKKTAPPEPLDEEMQARMAAITLRANVLLENIEYTRMLKAGETT